jgi:hypothetical protein
MKVRQDPRAWQLGFDAARAAKLSGKPTPPPPYEVDRLSYWSGAAQFEEEAIGLSQDT